jgi:hypothetical protein
MSENTQKLTETAEELTGKPEQRPYWNPYLAGIALGLVLLASFVATGKGLGASGAAKQLTAAVLHRVNPTWTEENKHVGPQIQPDRSPLSNWIVFLAIGVAVGGLLGSLSAGRFRVETVRGPRIGRDSRLVLALTGGLISGVAAQIARGCTSGQALTGGAQLALGSWVFMFAVFGGAYALAYLVRRQWI